LQQQVGRKKHSLPCTMDTRLWSAAI